MTDAPIKALVAVDAGLDARDIASALPDSASIQVLGVVEGMDEAWRTLQDSAADVLVVACLGYSERALYLIDGAVKQDAARPVVVMTQGSPNGFVARVFEAGADDLIVLPQPAEDVRFAIAKAVARKSGSASSSGLDLARLICVLGPKGGTGKTLTSVNLGVALADRGFRTVLVDLDLQFGDVALTLGLSPRETIHDLVTAPGTLDSSKVDDFLTQHESGLRVLLAPMRPDQASSITVAQLRQLYTILRANYDYVLVDTPPGFTPEVITSIDASTDLVIVGMLDALSLKNTKLGLETLQLMGYRPDRIRVILNRAQTKIGISQNDVRRILGRSPDIYVPSDREVPRALSEGRPIVTARPGSEAAQAFRLLAALLVAASERADDATADLDASPTAAGESRRRLFGRKAADGTS